MSSSGLYDWVRFPLMWENKIDCGPKRADYRGGHVLYAAALAISLATFSWYGFSYWHGFGFVVSLAMAVGVLAVYLLTQHSLIQSNREELQKYFPTEEPRDSCEQPEDPPEPRWEIATKPERSRAQLAAS